MVETSCGSGTRSPLVLLIAPYSFPLLLEFSILVIGLYVNIWERCRLQPTSTDRLTSGDSRQDLVCTHLEISSHVRHRHRNSYIGLFLGWIIIIVTIATLFASLYNYYVSHPYWFVDPISAYAFHISLHFICLLAVIGTMTAMSAMATRRTHITSAEWREYGLQFVTFFFLVMYKICCIVAGSVKSEPLLIIDGTVSIINGIILTIFIVWYAPRKCLTTPEQHHVKPGRQGLEILRYTNFSLWLVNTFLLTNSMVQHELLESLGINVWPIISNVAQPMTILFHFHAMMCISVVIVHVHTYHASDTDQSKSPHPGSENLATRI